MANKRINDLPSESDPASTDVFPIDGATTRKSTRADVLGENLEAIRGLSSAADKGIQFTGAGTAATYDLTAAGKALLDDADAAAQRTTLGLVIGTDVQAYDADLDAFAAKTAPTGAVVGTTDTQTLTNKTLTSPTINGMTGSLASSVTGTTQSASDNSTKIATTAYVDAQVSGSVAGVSSIAGNTGAFTLSNGITNSTNDIRLAAGAVIDSAYAEYTSNTDISSAIPIDDTIPQSTEGVEILTVSITPKSVTNKLRVRFVGLATPSAAANIAVALFLNSETGARAARYSSTAINFAQVFGLELEFVPGSTSAQTLKIRAGVSTGTIRFNGTTSSRIFGGVCKTTLIVEEVIV